MQIANALKKAKTSPFFFPLLLILVIAFLYVPTLNDPFLSDDYDHLMFARSVYDIPSFLKILQIPGDVYRPVMNISILLDYLVWNDEPIGFHLTNVLLFLGTALLLYATVSLMSGDTFFAFASSLLFSLFPNHHESVTWISGRTDLLATFFSLLAIYTFLRFSTSQNYRWLAGAYLAAFLAYASKEIAITLPIIIAVLSLGYEKQQPATLKRKVLLWFPLPLLFVAYLLIRRDVIGTWIGGYSLFGSSSALHIGFPFLFLPYEMVKHLINFSWLGEFIPLANTRFVIHSVTLGAGLIFVLLGIIFNLQRIRQKAFLINILFLLAMVYFVTLPSASIVPSVNNALMNTRVFYLASIPLSLVIAYLLVHDRATMKRARIGTFSVLCILFSLLFVMNYLPWREASHTAEAMLTSIRSLHPEYATVSYKTTEKEIFFQGLPDNIHGAYVFRNGFEEAVQVTFNNLGLFENPRRKNIWIAHGKKVAVTKACQFHKNAQTTGITVFAWDPAQNTFIERAELAEQYAKRQELRDQSLSLIDAFHREEWSGLISLDSPTLDLPPMIFSTFSFSLHAPSDRIGHFAWKAEGESSFHPDHAFLLPVKAGEHRYTIPLDTCPDWFLNSRIERLKITPTGTPSEITISDIRFE